MRPRRGSSGRFLFRFRFGETRGAMLATAQYKVMPAAIVLQSAVAPPTQENTMSDAHNHPSAPATKSAEKAAHLARTGTEALHEEKLLDNAVEDTFPASDPVAEMPAQTASTKVIDSEDAQLDKAIEASFPASDPVAGSHITKIVPEKK
jgi:hypothetical protein